MKPFLALLLAAALSGCTSTTYQRIDGDKAVKFSRTTVFMGQDIKGLVAVDITPNSNVVRITGNNGAGKSSVLDCIWFAVGGSRVHDDMPIRKGQPRGKITLDLGDIIVSRVFNPSGTTLTVESKDGQAVFKKPQDMLDSLLSKVAFDPLSFVRADAKAQFKRFEEAGIPVTKEQYAKDYWAEMKKGSR